MMNQNNDIIRKVFVIVGVCLLVIAMLFFGVWQWNIHTSEKRLKEYVSVIHELIPEPQGAVIEERRDNVMSTLSINGTDFVGLLEVPKYDSVLPICANWGNASKYPCRFSGSVYDRTMQIGATTQSGQYDFYRDISVGDSVSFIDMEGNGYSYKVIDICYKKAINKDTLKHNEASLTIFVKNIYAFEYIIIYCDVM